MPHCGGPGPASALALRLRRPARVAGQGVPRYSCGYKTRVFTGAICPVPDETETVVSKGAPT